MKLIFVILTMICLLAEVDSAPVKLHRRRVQAVRLPTESGGCTTVDGSACGYIGFNLANQPDEDFGGRNELERLEAELEGKTALRCDSRRNHRRDTHNQFPEDNFVLISISFSVHGHGQGPIHSVPDSSTAPITAPPVSPPGDGGSVNNQPTPSTSTKSPTRGPFVSDPGVATQPTATPRGTSHPTKTPRPPRGTSHPTKTPRPFSPTRALPTDRPQFQGFPQETKSPNNRPSEEAESPGANQGSATHPPIASPTRRAPTSVPSTFPRSPTGRPDNYSAGPSRAIPSVSTPINQGNSASNPSPSALSRPSSNPTAQRSASCFAAQGIVGETNVEAVAIVEYGYELEISNTFTGKVSELISLLEHSITVFLAPRLIAACGMRRLGVTTRSGRHLQAVGIDASPPDVVRQELKCPEAAPPTSKCYVINGKLSIYANSEESLTSLHEEVVASLQAGMAEGTFDHINEGAVQIRYFDLKGILSGSPPDKSLIRDDEQPTTLFTGDDNDTSNLFVGLFVAGGAFCLVTGSFFYRRHVKTSTASRRTDHSSILTPSQDPTFTERSNVDTNLSPSTAIPSAFTTPTESSIYFDDSPKSKTFASNELNPGEALSTSQSTSNTGSVIHDELEEDPLSPVKSPEVKGTSTDGFEVQDLPVILEEHNETLPSDSDHTKSKTANAGLPHSTGTFTTHRTGADDVRYNSLASPTKIQGSSVKEAVAPACHARNQVPEPNTQVTALGEFAEAGYSDEILNETESVFSDVLSVTSSNLNGWSYRRNQPPSIVSSSTGFSCETILHRNGTSP
jgi:hypothetical protein